MLLLKDLGPSSGQKLGFWSLYLAGANRSKSVITLAHRLSNYALHDKYCWESKCYRDEPGKCLRFVLRYNSPQTFDVILDTMQSAFKLLRSVQFDVSLTKMPHLSGFRSVHSKAFFIYFLNLTV